MASPVTRLLQAAFFRGLKVKPEQRWIQAYRKFGTLEAFRVQRDDGSLSCLRIASPGSSSDRTVILAHPLSRKGKYFFAEGGRIEGYASRGYQVVCFDFNGFGESDRIDLRYWKDAEAVIEYAGKSAHHLVIHGLSFGAFHMAKAIPALPPDSGAVFENMSRSVIDYWRRWILTRLLVTLLEWLKLRALREMNVLQFLREFDRRDIDLLFVGCEHDRITPVSEMRDLFDCAPEPKYFVVIEGAGHYEGPLRDPESYWRALQHVLRT